MEESWLLSLSIRFWHPTIEAQEIIDNINLTPDVIKTLDRNYLKKIGKIPYLKKGEEELTYVVFRFLRTADNSIDRAVEKANVILEEKIDFLKMFYKTGGKVDYYIYVLVNSEGKAAFELNPKIMKNCSKIGVTIGAEIHSNCYDCEELKKYRKMMLEK
jgi:hypothetical protein